MAYHKPTKKQRDAQAIRLDAMRRGRERAAMARDPRGRMPDLPLLRRTITVTDYDAGNPITHVLQLWRCGRVDQYRATADGKHWKYRIGWSRLLAGLRKAYHRLPGPRSDFWW